MKKAVKGSYGYLHQKRKYVILRTILYFALALAVFFLGIRIAGTRKNLLTIVAVLGLLPASKSFVNLVMYLKATGCSPSVKDVIEKTSGIKEGLYDMYFTSYQKNYAISHMVIDGKNICGFTESPSCDGRACEEHLSAMLKQGGHKDMNIKIFTDIRKYTERLKQLEERAQENDSEKENEVRYLLYDISL